MKVYAVQSAVTSHRRAHASSRAVKAEWFASLSFTNVARLLTPSPFKHRPVDVSFV